MDYRKLAQEALERRAAAFAQRTAIMENTALSEGERRTQLERVDADMARLAAEARAHLDAADAEDEVRSLQARAAVMGGNANVAAQAQRPGDDLATQFRSMIDPHTYRPVRVDIGAASMEKRVATVGTAGNAGNTVATGFSAAVVEAMRTRSDFFRLATIMPTATGNVIEFPVKNGLSTTNRPVSNVALVPENTTFPKGDESWTKVNMSAYKYGVIVQATKELLQDSSLPMLQILATDAGISVADVVLIDLLTGNGTNKPWGWLTRATAAENIANLAALTADDLIELQFSLAAPYRRNAVYMMGDAAIAHVMKLKDSTGNYLWQPSLQAGVADTFRGKPVLTDPNITTAGAGAKIVAFGDPSFYTIRQVNELEISRSDEYGWAEDVVSLKVSWRGSGDLRDTNSVKAITVTA